MKNVTNARRALGLGLSLALVIGISANSKAAPINIANGKPVIGGNSDYPGGNFNTGGTFATSNVTDGQNAAGGNNDTGAISEPFQDGSFWLGRQSVLTGYFVLDLGTAYQISHFQLFNTHDASYFDSGTGNFTITGSNTIADAGSNGDGPLGSDIVGGTLLASGTLTSQVGTDLVPDVFASLDTTNSYRYLRFDALSWGAVGAAQRVGLNEFRAFEVVPEPASLSLVLASGAMLLRCRARRA